MTTTQEDIRGWLQKSQRNGATHVIIVCDMFNWRDYPEEVQPEQDVQIRIAEILKTKMTKIMEVYDLALPLEPQLEQRRVWNLRPRIVSPIPSLQDSLGPDQDGTELLS